MEDNPQSVWISSDKTKILRAGIGCGEGLPSTIKYHQLPHEMKLVFTPEAYRAYCGQPLVFIKEPVYTIPWSILSHVEEQALRQGWYLILRTTSHSGSVPKENWCQRTGWIYGVPGKQSIIELEYMETYESSRAYSLEGGWTRGFTCRWGLAYNAERFCPLDLEFDTLKIGVGSIADGLVKMNIFYDDKAVCVVDRFNDGFWGKLARADVLPGPFQAEYVVRGLDGTEVLPGYCGWENEACGYEVSALFLQLLHASPFREWCPSICASLLEHPVGHKLTDGLGWWCGFFKKNPQWLEGWRTGEWVPAVEAHVFLYKELRFSPFLHAVIEFIRKKRCLK